MLPIKSTIKSRFPMPPQITCASVLPGKTGKHENHSFHSVELCYTHSAPEVCAVFLKAKLSFVMCLIASNICYGRPM